MTTCQPSLPSHGALCDPANWAAARLCSSRGLCSGCSRPTGVTGLPESNSCPCRGWPRGVAGLTCRVARAGGETLGVMALPMSRAVVRPETSESSSASSRWRLLMARSCSSGAGQSVSRAAAFREVICRTALT